MKKLTLFLAAAALVLVSCNKDDADNGGNNAGDGGNVSQTDLIGSWESTISNNYSVNLKENGTYEWDDVDGTWSYDNGKLTLIADEDELVYNVKLIGGKAALILQSDSELMMFYKQGATVQSPQLTRGRWDAPRHGEGNDYAISIIVDANKVDSVEMCVLAWGARFWGNASIENGVLKYNILKSQQGRDGDESGWWAGDAMMDPETFDLHGEGYHYVDGSEYVNTFSNMKVCVDPDGMHAYCAAVGLTLKLNKRQN